MDVHDSTASTSPDIVEIFLEGVHDQGSWHDQRKLVSWTKITLQFLGNPWTSLLSDNFDDLLKELWPITLICTHCFNNKVHFPFVIDKGRSKLFGIVVNVLREVEHDC